MQSKKLTNKIQEYYRKISGKTIRLNPRERFFIKVREFYENGKQLVKGMKKIPSLEKIKGDTYIFIPDNDGDFFSGYDIKDVLSKEKEDISFSAYKLNGKYNPNRIVPPGGIDVHNDSDILPCDYNLTSEDIDTRAIYSIKKNKEMWIKPE